VTTETVQYGWDGVLQALMARRKVAWMVVRTASVVSLDEGVLSLQFPKSGDVKGFQSSGYEGLLKEVLHERFGINVMIRAMAGGGSTAGPGQGARRSAPQPGTPAQPGAATPAQGQPPSAQSPVPSAMQSAAVQPGAVQLPAPHAAAPSGPAAAASPVTAPSPAAAPSPVAPAGPAAAPGAALSGSAAVNSVAPSHSVTNAATPAPTVTSNYSSYSDDVSFPSDDDPYALDGDEIEGSVDAGFQLTGITLIQRDLGAQIIAEYEE
jgi:DNA polymerase-3 subunit gamma/tau